MDCAERLPGECPWVVDHVARWQRAERCVEVVEAGARQFQRHAFDAELIGDDARSGAVGALTAAHPELAAVRIPDAVASAFEHDVLRQLLDQGEPGLRLQSLKGAGEDRLLALPLRMAEPRQKSLAVEHDGGVGGEHEIRKVRLWIDELDCGTLADERVVEGGPLPVSEAPEVALGACPVLRVHPRIDGVADRVILRAAHQEARLRSRICRLASHPPPIANDGQIYRVRRLQARRSGDATPAYPKEFGAEKVGRSPKALRSRSHSSSAITPAPAAIASIQSATPTSGPAYRYRRMRLATILRSSSKPSDAAQPRSSSQSDIASSSRAIARSSSGRFASLWLPIKGKPRLIADSRKRYAPATGRFGGPGRIRTFNPLLRRQMLYPLSYGTTRRNVVRIVEKVPSLLVHPSHPRL